jgi:hypothetical protein
MKTAAKYCCVRLKSQRAAEDEHDQFLSCCDERGEKEDEKIKQEGAARIDTFKRAFGACMDARGYSVK